MKVFVITGSTSGIGKALTEFFSKDNIVFAGYRDESKRDSLVEISKNIIPFYIDYSKPETIKSAVEFIKSKTSNIDVLLNVAGCVVAGAIECIEISELKRQFDVNVFGHLEFTQKLLSLLNNSKIINISSMASYGLFPFISPYCASKRALDIFFNSLELESKSNIKVVSIKPGVIATPLWSKSIEENKKTIDSCTNYISETKYLKDNALKNEQHGLATDKVVKVVNKVVNMRNPKPSYCVGIDAVVASLAAKLPQAILNRIIKLKLKRLS